MKKITVVNKNYHAPTNNDFYVGRGSVLGNPFTSKDVNKSKAIHQASSKEDAIESYRTHLKDKLDGNDVDMVNIIETMLNRLKIDDIYLVCYCKPNNCHGDVIKDYLLSKQMESLMKNFIK